MTQKTGVIIVHGIGEQRSDFSQSLNDALARRLQVHLADDVDDPSEAIVIWPIHWAPVLQKSQDLLWERISADDRLAYGFLRRFFVNFMGDAAAYQPTPRNRQVYDAVHRLIATRLHHLASIIGPTAPLCVIAHSLGTVVVSNYFYDLQHHQQPDHALIAQEVLNEIGETPLERGETLNLVYTMGSVIPLWSLRFSDDDFGRPMDFPPAQLSSHHPGLPHEWINFYDRHDIFGFPLRSINSRYAAAVNEDREINAGGPLVNWNPASHHAYWDDADVINPIAEALAATWRSVNGL